MTLEHKECACSKTQESADGYRAIIQSFDKDPGNIIPVLHALQAKMGYVSDESMVETAQWLGVPVSEVHGTATFYTLFSTKPKGRYIIRLCDSPPCHIEGSNSIKAIIEEELDLRPGETSKDGKFTLELVSCLGLCGVAPAVMINDEVYGNLTTQTMSSIIDSYRRRES